ncbi:MAG TPA: hypothetical protein VEA38_21190 [Terriglobales bacterium]|nr:hypothetical protein [Terriglobales bacterium]
MSQFGMSMPGGAMQRRPAMNVYTGLLFVAAMALLAAVAFVWVQASKVGAGEGFMRPFGLQQPASIKLPDTAPAAR